VRCGRPYIGTSGWLYPHWRERFYPAGLPAKRWLAWLAERFSSVEINGTFYRLQRSECFARWRQEVGDGFSFAVKASRYVTHMLKLKGGRAPLANFFAQGVLQLGAQLGPVLWQLPPMLGFSAERAGSFFAALPRDLAEAEKLARRHDARLPGRATLTAPDGRHQRIRHALEVRHPGWLSDEALQLMSRHQIALVTADTAQKFPLSFARTADFAYVRLHGSTRLYGSRYDDGELDQWAARVAGWLREGADVYVYFDNDYQAYAPGDALRLIDRVERLTGLVVDQRPQGGFHDAEHQGDHRGVQRSDPFRPRRHRRLRRSDRQHSRARHQRAAPALPR
jgi:uncharacterized protein YecE (DUF72 family)